MEKTQTLTPAQRKALADMFAYSGTIRDRAVSALNSARNILETSLLMRLAEDKGALQLTVQIDKCREQLRQAEGELCAMGFSYDSDEGLSFETNYAPKSLMDSIEKRLDKEIGSMSQLYKRLDESAIRMWTIPTLEQAEKLVDSFLSGK